MTHNSTTSFSLNELGPNGVPLPQVVTSTQIQFQISKSSPSVGSISTEAVTMDNMDMLVRQENLLGQLIPEKEREGACDVRLRWILKFYN